MKELSIEQKAKRYDEALKVANKYKDTYIMFPSIKEEMFPELCESEDERIRKNIISWLKNMESQTIPINEFNSAIAWLEKQGEIIKEWSEMKINRIQTELQEMVDLKQKTEQGEQKPVDKVEPKFKAGDWCIDNEDDTIFQIVKVLDNTYTYKTNKCKEHSCTHYSLENDARLWTIQDAKDGDVLFTSSTASHETFIFKSIDEKGNVKCYFTYDSEDGFKEGKYHFIGRAAYCKPATKEQRDLLFQKMKEAGYEWDDEKKELRKIEQKPAWCEEDEVKINRIVACLENLNVADNDILLKDVDYLKSLRPQPKQEWSQNDIDMIDWLIRCCEKEHEELCNDKYGHQDIVSDLKRDCRKKWNWLESLKNKVVPQNRWKPSEYHLKSLQAAIGIVGELTLTGTDLKELSEQLKKLREE